MRNAGALIKFNSIINANLLDKNNVKYSFFFVSLMTPAARGGTLPTPEVGARTSKALVKRSYLLLAWLHYISSVSGAKNKVRFFIMPFKNKIFTLTKAPMAHKTWSKEQYKYQYYRFKVVFDATLKDDESVRSVNAGLLFALLFKKNLSRFETSVVFLKAGEVLCSINEKTYFNFYRFCRAI